jgi:hypothetical protein
MSFLIFNEVANLGKKTKRWTIHPRLDTGTIIGWIEFRPTWRKYVWAMAPESIFDAGCTQEVVDFLKLHKDDRQ